MTFRIETDYPLAIDSPDHLHPWGTAADNHFNPDFNRRLLKLVNPVAVLDLGCAGGGMVQSFLKMGQLAVGIDGSNYSLKFKRAAWAKIPGNLFTADIAKPFTIYDGMAQPYQFDVVTAWEFFEHIKETDLPMVMDNILKHLKPGGLLIGTTTNAPSRHTKYEYHQTRQPREWWLKYFSQYGFIDQPALITHFYNAWVRNGRFKIAMKLSEAKNGSTENS